MAIPGFGPVTATPLLAATATGAAFEGDEIWRPGWVWFRESALQAPRKNYWALGKTRDHSRSIDYKMSSVRMDDHSLAISARILQALCRSRVGGDSFH